MGLEEGVLIRRLGGVGSLLVFEGGCWLEGMWG